MPAETQPSRDHPANGAKLAQAFVRAYLAPILCDEQLPLRSRQALSVYVTLRMRDDEEDKYREHMAIMRETAQLLQLGIDEVAVALLEARERRPELFYDEVVDPSVI